MSDGDEREADAHVLFQISQNMDVAEEARDQAEQRLRELGGGNVYVPPPTVLVTPSRKRGADESEDPSESQPANESRKKRRLARSRPREPVVIPPDVEVISISSDSEDQNSAFMLDATMQYGRRRRIYHPENHTSTCWRCPVRTCRRHSPEFGFRNHAYVERHLRNRHANELVYACISGCSIAFANGRAWERHHWDFHRDEVVR